jgi:hypothetical protein
MWSQTPPTSMPTMNNVETPDGKKGHTSEHVMRHNDTTWWTALPPKAGLVNAFVKSAIM